MTQTTTKTHPLGYFDRFNTGRKCQRCHKKIFKISRPNKAVSDGMGGEMMLLEAWFECPCGWSNESTEAF